MEGGRLSWVYYCQEEGKLRGIRRSCERCPGRRQEFLEVENAGVVEKAVESQEAQTVHSLPDYEQEELLHWTNWMYGPP